MAKIKEPDKRQITESHAGINPTIPKPQSPPPKITEPPKLPLSVLPYEAYAGTIIFCVFLMILLWLLLLVALEFDVTKVLLILGTMIAFLGVIIPPLIQVLSTK